MKTLVPKRKLRKKTVQSLKAGTLGFKRRINLERNRDKDNILFLSKKDVNITQPVFYNNKNEIHGSTSINEKHKHKFIINKQTKEVIIFTAYHPSDKKVYHNHEYVGLWPNGRVTSNQSACYPECENGVGSHNHDIVLTEYINNV
tara:strand:- start:142 stop:576 length:435 start_codon:yes stop_codon:yes gene_type:complete